MSQMNIYDPEMIRKECIQEHGKLLEQAVKTLAAKGCKVHLAKDSAEAAAIIQSLCGENQKALCSFSSAFTSFATSSAAPLPS